MNAQQIATLLGRLQRMATRWQDLQDIPAIERDLMLARLSELYEEVVAEEEEAEEETVEVVVHAEQAEEPVDEPTAEAAMAPMIN